VTRDLQFQVEEGCPATALLNLPYFGSGSWYSLIILDSYMLELGSCCIVLSLTNSEAGADVIE